MWDNGWTSQFCMDQGDDNARPATVWGSTIISTYSLPTPLGCKVCRMGLGWVWDGFGMGLGWLGNGKNIQTQMGECSSALDTILVHGGIEIQNGRVTHLVGGFVYYCHRGWRWRVACSAWIYAPLKSCVTRRTDGLRDKSSLASEVPSYFGGNFNRIPIISVLAGIFYA
jgi:hypothetical protein